MSGGVRREEGNAERSGSTSFFSGSNKHKKLGQSGPLTRRTAPRCNKATSSTEGYETQSQNSRGDEGHEVETT